MIKCKPILEKDKSTIEDSTISDTLYRLSKSRYIRGLQCHKSLYLYTNHPELRDEVTEDQQALFGSGTDVGLLAQSLFPGGVKIPFDGMSISDQIKTTSEEIDKGTAILYEGAFSANSVFVKTDILRKGVEGWEIYEVKASTGVKDHHYDDVAVQYHVVKGTGLSISKAFVVFVNNQYVRQGDLDIHSLFNIQDVTEEVRGKEKEVIENIRIFQDMLGQDCPVIDIGKHCDDPFECDFKSHCWSHIPSPSVFDYKGTGKPDGFALYRQGIVKMEDVSPDILRWRQKMQLDGVLHQKNHIDVDALRNFIESLWHPLCFMDFETTYMIPIPMYDGTRPYQQVPFQFSLHIMDKPGGELSHYEFLADGKDNPYKEFLEKLLAAIPRNACIIAWNQSFEIQRLKELADAFPEKSADIYVMIENIRDMMIPFRDKSIYHWKFNGSYSIKVVLPALIPKLSYDNLEISDGKMASSGWVRMIQSDDDNEKETLRKQLLEYCHLDTLAMVRILEIMINIQK